MLCRQSAVGDMRVVNLVANKVRLLDGHDNAGGKHCATSIRFRVAFRIAKCTDETGAMAFARTASRRGEVACEEAYGEARIPARFTARTGCARPWGLTYGAIVAGGGTVAAAAACCAEAHARVETRIFTASDGTLDRNLTIGASETSALAFAPAISSEAHN
jgi:hypothetical protein